MSGLLDIWKQELKPPPPVTASVKPPNDHDHGHLDAYWLALIGYNAAAAHSEIKHKDPQEAKRLLADVLNRYLRSPCVEDEEAEILRRAMK